MHVSIERYMVLIQLLIHYCKLQSRWCQRCQSKAQIQVCYLEAGEQRLWEGVKGAAFGLRLVEVELPSKQLHAEQSEDDEEEEEEEQQGGDGLHGVQQGRHQIGQSRPMAEQRQSDIRGGTDDSVMSRVTCSGAFLTV